MAMKSYYLAPKQTIFVHGASFFYLFILFDEFLKTFSEERAAVNKKYDGGNGQV